MESNLYIVEVSRGITLQALSFHKHDSALALKRPRRNEVMHAVAAIARG